MGVDAIGESQLAWYPGNYPFVSMFDYETGEPIVRLRGLQLLQKSFAPGDEIVVLNSLAGGCGFWARIRNGEGGRGRFTGE